MNGVPVNVENFDNIVCDCGGDVYMELCRVKFVPALMSPTNTEMPMPYMSTLACAKCGKDVRFAMERMKNSNEQKSNLIL